MTRPLLRSTAVAALTVLACAAPAGAAKKVELTRHLIGHFDNPDYVTSPPAGPRLFVVERPGRIRVIRHGKRVKRPFLDIAKRVRWDYQRGLLGLAFAPDYSRSGRFYVLYVTTADTVQLDEFRRAKGHPDRAAPGSRRPLMNIGRAWQYHHGGQLQFGPDGYLYVSTGVADQQVWAQHLDNVHGKILRIDPHPAGGQPYSVPADNPFVGVAGARPEIWAYGLRNPWRFSFDRKTGDLTLGDVGEDTYEEVDFLKRGRAGANFGYNVFEGRHQVRPGPPPERYVPPVIVHKHKFGQYCAVIGGYVVRDHALKGLYGRYLYNDMCSTRMRSAKLRPGHASGDRRVATGVGQVISFGEDHRGRLYVATLYDQAVFRLGPKKKR